MFEEMFSFPLFILHAYNVCGLFCREGASVLVHGTEGIDSTLQVTSLAQIILDPECRTIRGFETLIEREWLQVGRPKNKNSVIVH